MMLSSQYIAGFFDADGSVGIYSRGNCVQVNVTIANSGWQGRLICEELKKKFSGCITYQTKAKKGTQRDVFWFKLNGRKTVKEFLLHILDYLIIKKDQAVLCLEFIDRLDSWPRFKTQEQKQMQQQYIDKCKDLKRKS